MRTIACEEHFAPFGSTQSEMNPRDSRSTTEYMAMVRRKLADIGSARIADMDAAGIDMQVLSLSSVEAGTRSKDSDSVAVARDANDMLAEAIRSPPMRYAGFATLAMHHPESAAAELDRCVTQLGLVGAMIAGTIDGRFLDDRQFEPVLAAAEQLGVPLYLHPAPPPKPVFDAYYAGLPDAVSFALSISGYGWHAEMGLHILRLILSGVFDRFPKVQMIVGHMGEFIPYCLARSDVLLSRAATHLARKVSEYFRANFYITTSGYFTVPPFLCALSVAGVERILFAVDYPYSPNAAGRVLLDSIPVSPIDREMIAHVNAERLLKLPS